jgi:hypothetical protein
VFPRAASTVTLVDRLVHRSEFIEIDGDSYRLKEAKERQAKRTARSAPSHNGWAALDTELNMTRCVERSLGISLSGS